MKIEEIIDFFFMVLKRTVEVIEKLRKGEIDPEKVNLDELLKKIEGLEDLEEK